MFTLRSLFGYLSAMSGLVLLGVGMDAIAQTTTNPVVSVATNKSFLVWVLGGIAALMIIKSGLEFFGILPPPNKAEIKKLTEMVTAIHEKSSDQVKILARQKAFEQVDEILKLSITLDELHHTPVGKKPAWWCGAPEGALDDKFKSMVKAIDALEKKASRDPTVDLLNAQNSEMIVRLLQEILERQGRIEEEVKEIKGTTNA